ncbi:hypothetical protein ACP4OV_023128 [Aristida adscensionis]
MAPPSHVLSILLISPLILAMVGPSLSCPCTCESELNWRLYLEQVTVGQDYNQETIISASQKAFGLFGTTIVNDWTLKDAPTPNAKVVGRAQGVHILSDRANVAWYTSLNMVFKGDRFDGSTLQVMGALPPTGEWAIVGGTGNLTMARGTIKHRGAGVAGFRELDIHAFYNSNSGYCSGTVIVAKTSAQDK